MKRLLFLMLLFALPAFGQGVRFGEQQPVTSVQTSGGVLYSVPNATINWCNFPANGVPCTNKATTYSGITLATPCSTSTQVTLTGSSNCVATTDPYGNWGVWVAAGTYTFTITIPNGNSIGPFTVTLSSGGGTNILPLSNTFTGTTNNFVNILQVGGNNVAGTSGVFTIGDCISVLSTAPLVFQDAGTCGGGGGSGTVVSSPRYQIFYQPNAGSSATAQGASGITTDSTFSNLFVGQSAYTKGPNPWIDSQSYNMRSVVSDFTATANCVGTTAITFTAGNYANFQNGDGILLPGCGASSGLSTPSAPTVTPALISGTDTANDAIAGPAGATTYNYCVVQRDKGEGYTACSATGTTTTGASALGKQTVNMTSQSRSGQTVSVVLSTSINCVPGAWIYDTASTDASFSGFFKIATCNGGSSPATTTQLTYTQGYSTTKPIPCNTDGSCFSTNSATGGTVSVWNVNLLTLPASCATYQCLIYTAGGAFRGYSRPGELSWTDFGAAAPSLPAWFPATAPGAGAADGLSTTIVSGAPTANVVVAAAASQTVSGVTAVFDDAPIFQTLCNAAVSLAGNGPSSMHLSSGGPSSNYYFNSHTTCGGLPKIFPAGHLVINESQEFSGSVIWDGGLDGTGGSSAAFDWSQGNNVYVNGAYPGFIFDSIARISNTQFTLNPQGLGFTFPAGGVFNSEIDHTTCTFVGTDITGLCGVLYGQANMVLSFDTFSTNDSSGYGYFPGPLLLSRDDIVGLDGAGDITMDHLFFVGRGFGMESVPLVGSNSKIIISNEYNQFVVGSPVFVLGPMNQPTVWFNGGQNDSSSVAMLGNFGTSLSAHLSVIPDNSVDGSGRSGTVTGNPISNLRIQLMGNQPWLASATPTIGQNINVVQDGPGCVGINTLCTPSSTFALNVNGSAQVANITDSAALFQER